MQSSSVAILVTFAWFPTVLYLFWRFPSQQAIILSFIGGWLFLPVIQFALPGIPDITKMNATCYSILLATLIYDPGRITSFRLGWLDLPMLVWCLCPFASSITNDLGVYDGISAVLEQTMTWGAPYFLGRIYANNLTELRRLAMGIFIGGLMYVPLSLLENIISPQLHKTIYGYYGHPSGISQAYRYGGWRPMVFMDHGLMVGMWMMTATLIGIWLWRTGVIHKVWKIPMGWLVGVLLITFLMARSTGAYTLLVFGFLILLFGKWFRVALPLFLLIVGISSYLYISSTGSFSSKQVISFTTQVINAERAESLGFRFENEQVLGEKARQKMLFGWGGWGRNLIAVYEKLPHKWGYDIVRSKAVTDSLWIIAFGTRGIVGLIAITASLLLPALWFVVRYPATTWSHPKVAPAAVLAVLLCLYMLDSVLNAMINPVFALISGGLVGLGLPEPKTKQLASDHLLRTRRSLAPKK